jgi:hypothetical protein
MHRPANPATGVFDKLSLRDLLDARDLYHVHLMHHANVLATAIGLYRIRERDSWPDKKGKAKRHYTYPRTLKNSQVRYYSWPCILVFVEKWEEPKDLEKGDLVPKTLYLPDGRQVPVCVVLAPKEDRGETAPIDVRYPLNNIGGGSPVIALTQARQYVATVACLVSDGHKVYALTNRHVAGDAGEIVYSRLGGKLERIGVSSDKQLTRMPFTALYPGWPGRDVYVNLDVGLIELDDLSAWTARIKNVGQMGKMLDLSATNISLELIGQPVRGTGAASGEIQGEIAALFYRYKTNAGFEYVADVMIGPRSPPASARRSKQPPFSTLPGYSGTLWLLDPKQNDSEKRTKTNGTAASYYLPFAMQWGRNMLYSAGEALPQSYVLATFLSRVCAELGVDPVRNWNLDQPDTWGALGHFSIAARTQNALSNRFPKLVKLMRNNALIVSHDGDPLRKVTYTFKKGKREGEQEERPFGQGVHTAYEDTMISAFRETILDGLRSPPKAKKQELVENGFEAALQTVAMMRKTFRAIPPAKIVDVFASFEGPPSKRSNLLWERFGKKTIGVMQDGAHLLAVLWESAWAVGEGEKYVSSTRALTESEAMRICADEKFVPSVTIDKIGSLLSAAP